MKPLLLILMLCGDPYFIIGYDEEGLFSGYYDTRPPEVILDRLMDIFGRPDKLTVKYSLEDMVEGVCV